VLPNQFHHLSGTYSNQSTPTNTSESRASPLSSNSIAHSGGGDGAQPGLNNKQGVRQKYVGALTVKELLGGRASAMNYVRSSTANQSMTTVSSSCTGRLASVAPADKDLAAASLLVDFHNGTAGNSPAGVSSVMETTNELKPATVISGSVNSLMLSSESQAMLRDFKFDLAGSNPTFTGNENQIF